MTNKPMIKVLVVDDHPVFREGLKLLLNSAGDVQVIGEADNGREAIQLAQQLRPDVILLDIAMPILNGIEASRQIMRDLPTARVLILSTYREDEFVRAALNHGVAGYVAKQSATKEVLDAIRQVHAKNNYFSASIAKRLNNMVRSRFQAGKTGEWDVAHLTSRETETLQLIAEGHGNKQIAAILGISVKTVEKHRQQLMEKLNLHDIAGLTRYAISRGMVEATPALPITV
jgi:DNA-binding NarL/FixJ family response regulator